MRKRTVSNFFDSIMWYLIYLLPFIITFIYASISISTHYHDTTFTFNFFTTLDGVLSQVVSTNNIIYTTLDSLFGASGIFVLFNSTTLIMYFTYFCCCWVAHCVVDFLVLIPRIIEKLTGKVVQ